MSDELDLVWDRDGLAVIGDPMAVEHFLSSAGVASKDLQLDRKLSGALNAASGIAQAGSQIAATSGRWVKLTDESAKALKVGTAMKGSADGASRAVLTAEGKISKILEFASPRSAGSMLTNPAMLAGAAGIMAQFAMQQTMAEITEYLAVIDEKVDDILRAQKDAAVAGMVGVGLTMDEAMLKREHVGRVSEVTWSSLHGAAQTIASTQAYALRQIDALAEKLENKSEVGELAKHTSTAENTVKEWLAVLARCFQLQDALAVLELDRVLDANLGDLDQHRTAVNAARAKRRDLISSSTERLLVRMNTAAEGANKQVLFHPRQAGKVVHSRNKVTAGVVLFHEKLGIEASASDVEAVAWRAAAGDVRDDALDAGGRGIEAVRRLSLKTIEGAKAGTAKITAPAAERMPWNRSKSQRSSAPERDTATSGDLPESPGC